MSFEKTDRAEDKESANKLLQQMQEPITYTFPAKKVSGSRLKKIPFLSRLVTDSGELGYEVVHFSSSIQELRDSLPSDSASGLHVGAVVVAALDFALIPVIYLSAYILGEKVPFTLNNNARWVYSAVLLGLTLTALLVPATAPYIGLAAAGLTLTFSAFLLGKALYERYQLAREKRAIKKEIAAEENELQRIQNEAKELQTYLNTTTDEQQLGEIFQQITVLNEQYEKQKTKINALKEQEHAVDQEIKKLGLIQILDKGLAVSFAAIAVVGLALSLFFPPIGFGIVAGVSVIALTYATARLTYPIFRALATWALSKFRDGPVAEGIEATNASQPEPGLRKDAVMSQHVSEEHHMSEQEHQTEQSYEVMEHLLGVNMIPEKNSDSDEEQAQQSADPGSAKRVDEVEDKSEREQEEESDEKESEGDGEDSEYNTTHMQ